MILAAALAAASLVGAGPSGPSLIGLGDRPVDLTGPDPVAYSHWLAGSALAQQAQLGGACADAQVKAGGAWQMPEPLVAMWPKLAAARRGPVLVEHLQVTGCGRTTEQNVLVARQASGDWLGIPLLPGQSRTDPVLQMDVLRAAMKVAASSPPAVVCSPEEQARTVHSEEVKVVAAPNAKGIWVERWPLRLCGSDRPLTITFTPAATAGATDFNVRPAWK